MYQPAENFSAEALRPLRAEYPSDSSYLPKQKELDRFGRNSHVAEIRRVD